MLNLRRDLFIHLAISSQKNKSLNSPFRVNHVEIDSFMRRKDSSSALQKTMLESKLSGINMTNASRPMSRVASNVEKIDEKVEKTINDPFLSEIRIDLEVAEGLLKKIKIVDPHNAKIPVLEQNIVRLKLLLEQKSYV